MSILSCVDNKRRSQGINKKSDDRIWASIYAVRQQKKLADPIGHFQKKGENL